MNQQFIVCNPRNDCRNHTRLAGSPTPIGAGTGAGTLAAHALPPGASTTGGRDLDYHEGET